MKKIHFFTAILALSFGSINAQITITAATNNPVVGDVLFFHTCDTTGITKGASGASVTWNYSALVQTSLDTSSYVTCASTPYCDSFPTSTIAATDNHGNYSYYIANTNAFSYLGYEYTGYSLHYSNPIDYGYYPLTYNSVHVDTGINPLGSSSITYLDSFKCDGYGTLILPTGTYTNVLRVHETQYAVEGPTPSYSWRSEYYLWYTPGIHGSVLYMGYDTTGSGTPHISYVGYISRTTTAVPETGSAKSSIMLYPNPANELLHIAANEITYNEFSICNAMGQEVRKEKIAAPQTDLNINDLVPGVYYVRFTGIGCSEVRCFFKH